MAKVETAANIAKPFLRVKHADLKRLTDASPFRSWCPVCDQGVLLVRRLDFGTLGLSKIDNCSLCAQRVIYEEDEIAGEKLAMPLPTNMGEAFLALDAMLVQEDKDYLRKAENADDAAVHLHHSLGRHLRNEWGLWTDSPIAQYLKALGVDHPDDMSHHILVAYCRENVRSRFEREEPL